MLEFALITIPTTFISQVVRAHLGSRFVLGNMRGRLGHNGFCNDGLVRFLHLKVDLQLTGSSSSRPGARSIPRLVGNTRLSCSSVCGCQRRLLCASLVAIQRGLIDWYPRPIVLGIAAGFTP